MSLPSTAEVDLVRQIALPSRLGETLGQQIWGHEWTPFPFILEAEREIVEACLSQDTQDWFILNCPNQVGKTSWATLLIFWYIGMFPDKQVIFISYSDGYCMTPETPILTDDLRYVPVGELKVGDTLATFTEERQGRNRHWEKGVVTSTGRRDLHCYEITLDDGTKITSSDDHKWIAGAPQQTMDWVTTAELAKRFKSGHPNPVIMRATEPWETDTSREAGYLAGMFDGEGTIAHTRFQADGSSRGGLTCSLSQCNNSALAETKRCLEALGFKYSEHVRPSRQDGLEPVHQITIRGGVSETLRFLGTVRPQRLIDNYLAKGGSDSLCRFSTLARQQIVDVRDVGMQEVVTLSTSSGTLIADGLATHNSTEYGRLVRDLFKTHGKRLFGVEVDPGNDSIGDWSLKGHPSGGMLSVGIGGQITGRQGHLVVIDDILRTMMDAASATIKDGHWKEWQGSIWGRRQPGCVYVLTATRLAIDDLTGRLLEQTLHSRGKGIQWNALIYQGLCELPDDYEGDPEDYRDSLGRKVGEPLQTRFSKPTDTPESNWWTDARDALDNQPLFDCMVQQNPGRSESGMFPTEKWKYELRENWPPIYAKARGWDIASTGGGGDYSVGALVGRAPNGDIYIFGREREQMGSHDGIERVRAVHQADGGHIPLVIEEEKGGGRNLVEFYRREVPGATVIGSPVTGSKEQRATPYSVMQQGGRVWLPADEADSEWVQTWVKEHAGMMGDGRDGRPGRRPRHDDQIDAASHAINYLLDHGVVEIADPNQANTVSMEMLEFLEEMGLAW